MKTKICENPENSDKNPVNSNKNLKKNPEEVINKYKINKKYNDSENNLKSNLHSTLKNKDNKKFLKN